MIKTILAWITGKSEPVKAAEAPYKIDITSINPMSPVATKAEELPVSAEAVIVAPEAVVPEAVVPAAAVEVAPVTVKAKYKRVDLNKMTKAQLMELITKHSLEVKARATKEELVKVLVKV
jgi:hypothetical protein